VVATRILRGAEVRAAKVPGMDWRQEQMSSETERKYLLSAQQEDEKTSPQPMLYWRLGAFVLICSKYEKVVSFRFFGLRSALSI
jgi:hypothetical protein